MSLCLPNSHFSSCFFFLLLVMAFFHLCLSNTNPNAMLCMDDERQALLQFKRGLIDDTGRLASWVQGETSDCCKWAGIACDNMTGHVHKIHLPASHCDFYYYTPEKAIKECMKQKLRGDLSSSLLNLKQLKHLDLSENDFGGKKIPTFVGSLTNLRYLNLSGSQFGGTILSQLGNLTELRTVSLRLYYVTSSNMQWLSGLRFLHHLDMSGVNLSKAVDWLQVINTLPSLNKLHLSNCELVHAHPHVSSLNLTSLSLLDLSRNIFNKSLVLRWVFSLTSVITLDLTYCSFSRPSSNEGFHNMTSLKLLYVAGNGFINSPFVLKGLSSSNLVSLDIRNCGVSSLVLESSLHNLTSLLYLNMVDNLLTKTIPKSLGNVCNLRDVDLSGNYFGNISLTFLLESFFECKLPRLESLEIEGSELSSHLPHQLGQLKTLVSLSLDGNRIVGKIPNSIGQLINLVSLSLVGNRIVGTIPNSIGQLINLVSLRLDGNRIVGTIPNSIGQLSFLKYLRLDRNLISGPIPYTIGGLSSMVRLNVRENQLNGSLPDSLGLLSNLIDLDISYNLLTGFVTDAHFANLKNMKFLSGSGNNLIFRPRLANWHPHFRLRHLDIDSWDIGPQFPLWLLQQSDLVELMMRNVNISTTLPLSFGKLFPNLEYLDMSQNYIQGRLFDIPRTLVEVNMSYNQFSGKLPTLLNSSILNVLDLSHNSFVGSLRKLICLYGGADLVILNLANNHLSGAIPDECWDKYPMLEFLDLEDNNLSGRIPRSIGYLPTLLSLNICNNKLSGRLPTSLKNLWGLYYLQLARNSFVGRIPAWIGTELSQLRILNLRSNNFQRNLTHELCYLTHIHILDLAHNNLSGDIPRCFNNFTILTGKEAIPNFIPLYNGSNQDLDSASLVIKGREDIYGTILKLVIIVDLSSNNFFGGIPRELMALQALQSLNLSRNQLTGNIPKDIGDLKSLESFDVSFNQLSGELPASLSSLTFLSSFNVSYNNFTGRVPTGTQLQSFTKSSFLGNKLCGPPLNESCAVAIPNGDDEVEGKDGSHGAEWGLIISTMLGFIAGFWVVVVPLIVSTRWRITYFGFLRNLRYMVYDVIYKYLCNMFYK